MIDVSNPTNCVRVGGYKTRYNTVGVAVSGNYAYVADTYEGLQVIDVSNPANCVRVGANDNSGTAYGVAVSGNYAYLANGEAGLQVIDVRNPAHCVRVGGYTTTGYALGVTVSGNYAYVAADDLLVLDISDPTNCVRVVDHKTRGYARAVEVVADRIYVADGIAGLLILPSVLNFQHTLRIDATPNLPFTLEAATNLADPNSWQPLLTTNVATMPFDFVDFDVKAADKPQKFYRVRQP